MKCNIPCDFCKTKPAHWFGQTSVAVCNKPECYKKCNDNWLEHLEEMEREHEINDYYNEYYQE